MVRPMIEVQYSYSHPTFQCCNTLRLVALSSTQPLSRPQTRTHLRYLFRHYLQIKHYHLSSLLQAIQTSCILLLVAGVGIEPTSVRLWACCWSLSSPSCYFEFQILSCTTSHSTIYTNSTSEIPTCSVGDELTIITY